MIERPIFIIGCPRSGTTLLFRLLSELPTLWSIDAEGQHIWERYHHPRVKGWESSALEAKDVTEVSRRYIPRAFVAECLPASVWRFCRRLPRGGTRLSLILKRIVGPTRLRAARFRGPRPIRLVEKTPDNCLRLGFLDELFPDARFVYLKRDGRANVSSLIQGWRNGLLFAQHRPPVQLRIAGYEGSNWNFGLPPGWRALTDRPLEEVCARQWVAYNEAVLAAAPRLREQGRFFEVFHEELVGDPAQTLRAIARFAAVAYDDRDRGRPLPVVSIMTPPRRDKWKEDNAGEISRVLPAIRPTMERMGYQV